VTAISKACLNKTCDRRVVWIFTPISMTPDIPNIGSWLDALKQHSIFSLSEHEYDNWRYWENSDDDFLNKLPATMAIRDGDLFVAVGSTIRALNLNQFKNLWVKSIQEGGRFADWIHQFPYKVGVKLLSTPLMILLTKFP
jgi:hypothetical protein